MKIIETKLPGLLVIEPTIFKDARGYFYESYNKQRYEEAGLHFDFVQDNQSQSSYGVLRGLHYQQNPHAQAKLVRVISGSVWDVAVDIRKGSPTFGQWHAEELNAENQKQMLIPRGFAHGFVVLSETAEFFYKCDGYYNKESEGGIRFDDPALGIDWKLPTDNLILSDKDKVLPSLNDCLNNFEYQA